MNQQLELRVLARTEKLEIANHELSLALKSVQAMQTELVRTEKMAALGSLVAGVAHELNTPIGNSVTVGSALQHQAQELSAYNRRANCAVRSYWTYRQRHRGTEILMRALGRASDSSAASNVWPWTSPATSAAVSMCKPRCVKCA
jgi:signal transduction histidine kinase